MHTKNDLFCPRYRFTLITLLLFLVGIFWLIRLFSIQLIHSGNYQQIAFKQQSERITLHPLRGILFDRFMNPLTINQPQFSYFAQTNFVKQPREVASLFSRYSSLSYSSLLRNLQQPKKRISLAQTLTLTQAQNLPENALPTGVFYEKSFARYYPYQHLGKSFLGIVNRDGKGASGLESFYDYYLRGDIGWRNIRKSARQEDILLANLPVRNPIDGYSLILTIDADYQSILENNIQKGIERFRSKQGFGVIMRPQTGEILAMTSQDKQGVPSLNYLTGSYFEPGSALKAIVAAAAIEEQLTYPDEELELYGGQKEYFGRTIEDSHPMEHATFREMMAYSSNVGIIEVAYRLGRPKMHEYFHSCGFASQTGIDLHGETAGLLRPLEEWSNYSLPSLAIGQEIGTTALQLAIAFSAIANDGLVMKPYLVQKIVSPDGNKVVKRFKPKAIRRVFSENTCQTMRSVLTDVVEYGTGSFTKINGLKIAGKTGTPQRFVRSQQAYTEQDYMTVFGGMFPADHPELVIIIGYDRPQTFSTAAYTAVPTFRHVVEELLTLPSSNRLFDVTDVMEAPVMVTIHNFLGMTPKAAQAIAAIDSLSIYIKGNGNYIISQVPPPETHAPWNTTITLIAKQKEIYRQDYLQSQYVAMPDLRNMHLRFALEKLSQLNLKASVNGYGRVYSQSIAPGQNVKKGRTVFLKCVPN